MLSFHAQLKTTGFTVAVSMSFNLRLGIFVSSPLAEYLPCLQMVEVPLPCALCFLPLVVVVPLLRTAFRSQQHCFRDW